MKSSDRLRAAIPLLAAILFGLLFSPASAQEIDIPYDRFVLGNGLTVIVHEDRKAPVVGVAVWYKVGSKDEPDGKSGFAHLFEHLMFNGSENYDGEWFKPLQEAGATRMNGMTELDYTNYFETVPTPALDRALWMESDRMGHLLGAVTQKRLDEQRAVVKNEKRQGDNEPYALALPNLFESLFPIGHPYQHRTIGSMEDLDAASLEDVKTWFARNYGPSNAIMVLAGDIDAKSARPLVEKYFGDIPPGPPLVRWNKWVPRRTDATRATLYDQVPQARIYRAWAVPEAVDPASTALLVAASALGDGKNSRLYKELVYRQQIATNVEVINEEAQLASLFSIMVEVKPGVEVATVEAELDRQIAAFLKTGPTRDEVARASVKRRARIIRGLEEVGGLGKAPALARGELLAAQPDFYQREFEELKSVTPISVAATAREWLSAGWHQLAVLPFPNYSAAARGVDRSSGVPAIESEAVLRFPAIEEGRLSNGMRLLVVNRPAIPVVNVTLQFDAGYAADPRSKPGLANFTASMLDEGAGRYDALALQAELEKLGATIGASSNLDATFVALSALKTTLPSSLSLLSDVIRRSRFGAEDIERQRRLIVARIEQEKSDPNMIALRLFPSLLYGAGHAYGNPLTGTGSAKAVAAVTRDDLVAFRDGWLRPDNGTIFVVGDTSLAEVQPQLEQVFGNWQASGTKGVKRVTTPNSSGGQRTILIDRPDSPQTFILAGQLAPPTGAANTVAIETMNDIFGGSFTSRLNLNLREDKGWSYGAHSFLYGGAGQRPFVVIAPVQTDKTGPSIAEIKKEFAAYLEGKPPTDEELGLARFDRVRSLPGQLETARGLLVDIQTNVRYGRPLDYSATLPDKYRALSKADIVAAAREVLHPDRLIWIVIGDAKKIRAEVESAGIGPVEVRSMRDLE